MVLWFGLKERLEKVEQILEDTADAIDKLNESIDKLNQKIENVSKLKADIGEEDFETGSKTRKSVADKLLQQTERLKMATAMKRIQAIEKALGLPPVAQAVEESTGLEPDVIQNILDFVKQNPQILDTIRDIFSKKKPAEQQRQEVQNAFEQLLKPMPLKQSQGQTQQ